MSQSSIVITTSSLSSSFTAEKVKAALEEKGFTVDQISSTTPTMMKATIHHPDDNESHCPTSIPRSLQIPTNDNSAAFSVRIFVDPKKEATRAEETMSRLIGGAKVFVVGAGGIGCELLKDLFLAGWRDIEVIDMDTIDATNLNRQFLFRPEDVGKSKSAVAADRILSWSKIIDGENNINNNNTINTDIRRRALSIVAHHGNVKDPKFNKEFYQQFAVVINGLDNVSARKHVNRVCIDAGTALVESGTMGYNGQAQPIVRGRYACYDCHPKSAEQKTFAVCTIHSRPTTIVHCVHYAKELYGRLFGDAVAGASEFDFLNEKLASSSSSTGDAKQDACSRYALALGEAIFNDKIKAMIDLKKQASSNNTDAANTTNAVKEPIPVAVSEILKERNTDDDDNNSNNASLLKEHEADPQILPLLQLFAHAVRKLNIRIEADPTSDEGTITGRVPFDKNDDDAVNFVASVANLRAHIFHIPRKSNFELRTIAGNIVPAIASTNAAVAASAVRLATQLLSLKNKLQDTSDSASNTNKITQDDEALFTGMRSFPTRRKRILINHGSSSNNNNTNAPTKPVWELLSMSSFASGAPNPDCIVCRESTQSVLQVRLHAGQHTLGGFVGNFLIKEMSLVSPCVYNSSGNPIYEHGDYEDLSEDPMTKYVGPSNQRVEFDVEDLEQTIEWKVVVVHDEHLEIGDEGGSPFVHNVISRAAVNNNNNNNNGNNGNGSENNGNANDDAAVVAAVLAQAHGSRAIVDDDVIIYNPRQHHGNNNRERDENQSGGAKPRNEADTIELE